MPTLPLTLPIVLGAADPAVQSADDVLAVYPREYKTASHPVLDAINAGHAAVHIEYQQASDQSALQTDILRATGANLEGLGQDRGCPKAAGESDDDYRARVLAWKGVVTPDAIMTTVNAILAPYTTVLAQYCESILDRWFVEDGSAVWGSFVGDSATVTVGPQYLDRLYPDDAALNGGDFRPQSDPGEALIFTDDAGRCFFLRIPELNDANGPTAYACDGTGDPPPGPVFPQPQAGMFVEDGSATDAGMAYVSPDFLLADESYQAVINAVNRIKGAGVRWILNVDPRLQ